MANVAKKKLDYWLKNILESRVEAKILGNMTSR